MSWVQLQHTIDIPIYIFICKALSYMKYVKICTIIRMEYQNRTTVRNIHQIVCAVGSNLQQSLQPLLNRIKDIGIYKYANLIYNNSSSKKVRHNWVAFYPMLLYNLYILSRSTTTKIYHCAISFIISRCATRKDT